MKFKFESDLEYQLDAINSVVSLFDGQNTKNLSFPHVVEVNPKVISENKILENLRSIQKENNIKEGAELQGMDFSIEMETGTGKTYVYLRTILELNKKYGFKKFIIMVPSVAVREGVLKTLNITKEHFKQLYGNISYNFYQYDSAKLSKIREFSRSNTLEIMVMTLDSINKDTNIIKKHNDRLSGQKPIDMICRTNPILILDEPQNMESEKSKDSLKELNPLFKLRYSATHKNYYNLVYRLTPVDAYNKGLVKKIEVLSVIKDEDFNTDYIKCLDITVDKNKLKAQLEVNKKQKSGYVVKTVTVKHGDDLEKKSKNPNYQNFIVSGIDARSNQVKFSNGLIIKKGQNVGGDKEQIMKMQIRHTIEEHFRKQDILKPYGIKVLSLFFIDKVANYVEKEGFIRKTFIEEFNNVKRGFENYNDLDVTEVHKGYFSAYKSESGMESDKEAFDLIMKDKEKLLSFEEPTQFIFSHSALREGWDNPNVFNICTLNETVSELKKRQEIGRGVRLPVNQDGDRIYNLDFNILTVVANESYSDYVSKLQQEYFDEYGNLVDSPKPLNARDRTVLKLKKQFKLNPEFEELWKRISRKTNYAVKIDTKKLVEECVSEINSLNINSIRIKVEKIELSLNDDGIKTLFIGEESEESNNNFEIPNLIELIANETKLTRNTIYEILAKVDNFNLIFKNPQEYIHSVSLIILEKLKEFLVNGINYVEIEDFWQMELFKNVEAYNDYIIPDKNDKCIYDGIICDSDGEKNYAQVLEDNDLVKMFIKLPNWFFVETPIGKYNPDWAIVFDERDLTGASKEKLYLVRETKFVENLENLRPLEKYKIKCANEHFKTLGIDFKTVNDINKIK
ncbi:restriction endonuclease [Methanococcus maripaludis]|uniref:Type III restriction-modification system restriction subunit n=1 Tax=Methanococcus maripaludis OS7 TaxID=637915 RepID=A0A2Z5PG52_METMI|nr:DEAD/DEAH box helicase family protein [Methanococcus maripaludis]BAP62909.1 type III restriction-modification system restriction subunit [Methanococcus maripaludis OS7]